MAELVTVTVEGGIAEVRLNRPDKLNALNMAMFEALVEAGAKLASDPTVRVVVLTGEGSSFCVGLDLAELGSGQDGALSRLAERTHGDCNLFQQAVMQWRRLPVPVIAAVHGHALGGGLQLMLGADMRLAAPDTRLSIREVVWGLVPDMAGMVLLRQLLRDDVLRDLLMTGRTIDGREAQQLGLVTRVEGAPLAAARELASGIAASSPDAIRAIKRLANLVSSPAGEAEILLEEAREQQALLRSANHAEAVSAGMTNRAPSFTDPAPS